MRVFANDLRRAARTLARAPTFLAISVVSLGLALALIVVVSGVLDAVMHPLLPYRDADRLYTVQTRGDARRFPSARDRFSAIRDAMGPRGAVAAEMADQALVRASHETRAVGLATVTSGFFAVLGISPVLGRFDVGAADSERGAVLSERLWRQLFSSSRTIRGASVTLNGRAYPVIGVAPNDIPCMGDCDVWLPLPPGAWFEPAHERELFSLEIVVRLAAGETVTEAERGLDVAASRLELSLGRGPVPLRLNLHSLAPAPDAIQDVHVALLGAALVVFAIVCANLATLVLVRGLGRRRDLAVRAALGAGRGALIREQLAESAVIAMLGLALGMALASWGTHLAAWLLPVSVREVGILVPQWSWRVLAAGAVSCIVAVIIFGLVPALILARANIAAWTRDRSGSTTARTRRRVHVLVVAQIALALVLLMAAGLLGRAVRLAARFDYGYDASGVWTASVVPPWPRSSGAESTGEAFRRLTERVAALPGVEAASTMGWSSYSNTPAAITVADGGMRERRLFGAMTVSPDLLRTLRIQVVAGRDFAAGDAAGTGAVIVDEAAARSLWPRSSAVGRAINLRGLHSQRPWLPVVGVSRRVSLEIPRDLFAPPEGAIFIVDPSDSSVVRDLVVRGKGLSVSVSLDIRREVEANMPGSRVRAVTPWDEMGRSQLAAHVFISDLLAALAALSLALAAIGVYGVVAVAVTHRMREFGVRLALGARARDVLALVLRDGVVLALAGTGIGAFAAMRGARVLDDWLYGVGATDVGTLVTAEALLIAATLLACVGPALRATRADPADALRAS